MVVLDTQTHMAVVRLREFKGDFFVRFEGDTVPEWYFLDRLKLSAMIELRKVVAGELGAGAELRHNLDDATLERARKELDLAISDREAALDRVFAEAEAEKAEKAAEAAEEAKEAEASENTQVE